MSAVQDLKSFINRLKKAVNQSVESKQLKALGLQAIEHIRIRTRLGYGVKISGTSRFKLAALAPWYKKIRKEYKKDLSEFTTPNKSNLTFSGQMLESMKILKIKKNSVLISPKGRRRKSQLTNEEVAERVSGKRPFNNLSDLEIKKLIRFYRLNFGDLLKKKKLLK